MYMYRIIYTCIPEDNARSGRYHLYVTFELPDFTRIRILSFDKIRPSNRVNKYTLRGKLIQKAMLRF